MSGARDWFGYHSVRRHIFAPLWLRVPEKHRWRVVGWLNDGRLSDRFCWADLVSAALAYRESDACDVHTPRGATERKPRCATTCDWMSAEHIGEHPCSCYCGKFQFAATEGSRDRAES